MKKLICAITLVALCGGIAGCNYQLFDFDYRFTKAYVRWPDGTMKVIQIKKWKDYEGEQFQVIGKDGKTYLLSSFNTVLVNE